MKFINLFRISKPNNISNDKNSKKINNYDKNEQTK